MKDPIHPWENNFWKPSFGFGPSYTFCFGFLRYCVGGERRQFSYAKEPHIMIIFWSPDVVGERTISSSENTKASAYSPFIVQPYPLLEYVI